MLGTVLLSSILHSFPPFPFGSEDKPFSATHLETSLPVTNTVPLEPVSNPFLQLCLRWTNGVGLAQQISWSPCSLPLPLGFNISLYLRRELWGTRCLSALLLCGNLSSHTSWGTPCWGEMLGLSASHPATLRMLSAGSLGASSLFDVAVPFPLQWTVALALVFAWISLS